MLCGLQGSGKTTTTGKLARLIQENGKRVMLVAADLQRPAAIQQLHVLGEQLGVQVYSELGAKDPVKVCQDAVRKAKQEQIPVVILDTAGRLAIDRQLMDELRKNPLDPARGLRFELRGVPRVQEPPLSARKRSKQDLVKGPAREREIVAPFLPMLLEKTGLDESFHNGVEILDIGGHDL